MHVPVDVNRLLNNQFATNLPVTLGQSCNFPAEHFTTNSMSPHFDPMTTTVVVWFELRPFFSSSENWAGGPSTIACNCRVIMLTVTLYYTLIFDHLVYCVKCHDAVDIVILPLKKSGSCDQCCYCTYLLLWWLARIECILNGQSALLNT